MSGTIIRNTHRKPQVCRPQSENGIAAPPLPLKAVVAQRGASWVVYQRQKKRTNLRCGSRLTETASIADGVPPAAETGEPVPLFDSQVKIRSYSAPGCLPRTGKACRKIGIYEQ